MLIGIDASRAAVSERTGTENYSLFLIRALIAAGQEHQFRLYFNAAPDPTLFVDDERVELCVMPFPRMWTHLRLGWEVIWRPPDVLFVPSHVLPLLHPKRCVATVHDLGYLYYAQAHTRWARWYLDWSTRFNARSARRVIVDSEATRADLNEFYGVDPAKTTLAYPAGAEGYQPVTDPVLLATVRAHWNLSTEYFLYVGTLQPRKNINTLISAFARMVERDEIPSQVSLVIAGKMGWLYRDILERAQALGLGDRVVFTGYVSADDLPALLSGAVAFVLPSWYEGFGLPLLEAMACETPVICSNVASLPEVAGDAALLFDPHDGEALAAHMAHVYQDSELRSTLVERGRLRVQQFSWQQCADQVLDALEFVAAEG